MVGSAVPWWQVIQLNIVIVPESCEVTVHSLPQLAEKGMEGGAENSSAISFAAAILLLQRGAE